MRVECVVSVNSEAFDELEGLGVSENVVPSGALASGMGVAGWLVYDASPLVGVGSNVEPSFVVKVFKKDGYVFGFGIEVTKNERRAIGVSKFLLENGVKKLVGFGGNFFVGGASGIAIGIVRTRVKYVVEIKVSHVNPAGGFGELFVANGSRRDGEGNVP